MQSALSFSLRDLDAGGVTGLPLSGGTEVYGDAHRLDTLTHGQTPSNAFALFPKPSADVRVFVVSCVCVCFLRTNVYLLCDVCVCACVCVFLAVCLSVCLSICLSVGLSVYVCYVCVCVRVWESLRRRA